MPPLRFPVITDRWVPILGPLLVVGLLVQSVSVRPCGQTVEGPDAPGTVMTDASAATSGACAGSRAVPVVRAVPSASQGTSVGGAPDVDVTSLRTSTLLSGEHADRNGHLLLVSVVLEALRPVVLQI